MPNDLLDYVGLPGVPFSVRCHSCRKPLRVDVGVTVDGMPGAWAHCWTCDRTQCAVNKLHVMRKSRSQWAEGLTSGDGERVPCCTEGQCGKLLLESERMLVAFSSYPRGSEARDAVEVLKERAAGSDSSWLVLQARALLKVFVFHSQIKPVLVKERWAARMEIEEAAQREYQAKLLEDKIAAAERRAAVQAEHEAQAKQRWAAYVASGEVWSDSSSDERSFEELMMILDGAL